MFLIESASPWAKAAHHASTLTGMGELGFFTEEYESGILRMVYDLTREATARVTTRTSQWPT